MNEDFKMRCRDGPAGRREIILVVIDGDISVQRMLPWVADLTIYEQHFLVDLHDSQSDN